jgi:hypothetical protein
MIREAACRLTGSGHPADGIVQDITLSPALLTFSPLRVFVFEWPGNPEPFHRCILGTSRQQCADEPVIY